jgi:hypothetical protein
MPLWRGGRPLKRWRYVGVFADDVLLCAGTVAVGPARQAFWAVWERGPRRLTERTRMVPLPAHVRLDEGSMRIDDGEVSADISLVEGGAVETVVAHPVDGSGPGYVWTSKQGGIPARGTVRVGARRHVIDATAVVDDTAGYHARHTAWRWSAGVGGLADGTGVGWNLVTGVNDPPVNSERTVWVGSAPHEVGPVRFADDLSEIAFAEGGELAFVAEAERARTDRLLVISSRYRQPFGRFSGELPGAGPLAWGLGVMEDHEARW